MFIRKTCMRTWCYIYPTVLLSWMTFICGVIISMLASRVVNHGFEPRIGQTKDYRIGIFCLSAKHVALRCKSKGCDHMVIVLTSTYAISAYHH